MRFVKVTNRTRRNIGHDRPADRAEPGVRLRPLRHLGGRRGRDADAAPPGRPVDRREARPARGEPAPAEEGTIRAFQRGLAGSMGNRGFDNIWPNLVRFWLYRHQVLQVP